MPRPPAETSRHRYLPPEVLRRLADARFVPRRGIDGGYVGRHASRRRGRSIEFSDYRPYLPGDPLADVDWKVYGRSDRLYVKRFEHRSNLDATLLIDASASMAFAGVPRCESRREMPWVERFGFAARARLARAEASDPQDPPDCKYDYAAGLAAVIAYLLLNQQDRVGVATASGGLATHRPSAGSMSQLGAILAELSAARSQGSAGLAEAIDQLTARVRRRSVLIVLSDLWADRQATLRSLSRFVGRGGEAIVLHVLHRDELSLPRIGEAIVRDSETGAQLRLDTGGARADYQRRLREELERWRASCFALGADYQLTPTDAPCDQALQTYLARRGFS